MGRKREIDNDLPPRMYRHRNCYRYVPKKGKKINLGSNRVEAFKRYAELTERPGDLLRMGGILDRYILEVSPTKALSTYKQELYMIKPLKAIFADYMPEEITKQMIYMYLDKRGESSKTNANKEIGMLSDAFNKAIRWGAALTNPCAGIEKFTFKPRDRYIEDWEFAAVYNIAPPLIKSLMKVAYYTGKRLGDLISIKLNDITDEGIYFEQGKTNKKQIVVWSTDFKETVSEILKSKGKVAGMYLFTNRKGKPYSASGIKSIWQRTIVKALKLEVISKRFTFHDIRAKAASDIEAEHALNLMDHGDMKTTERVYRRNVKRVKPVK